MMNNEVARVSYKKRVSEREQQEREREGEKRNQVSGSLFIFHEQRNEQSVRADVRGNILSVVHSNRSDAILDRNVCWRNASANTKIEINNISRYRQPFTVLPTSMKTNKMPNNNKKRKK